MKCNKCGNEIEETNKFCTNCGYKLKKEKINTSKNTIYIKFNYLIIAMVIIIIIITLIFFFISINKNEKNNINQDINALPIEVQETKKYQVEIGKDYSYVVDDETSSITFNTETDFIMRTGILYSEEIIEAGTYIISDNIIKLTVNYNSNNDYGNEEENPNYVSVPYEIEMTILDDGNIEYKTKYGTTLYTKEVTANTNNTDNLLLDQIYSKYPELKSKEGYICTDGEQYWMLDNAGKKIYFTDIESFESALVKSYTSEINSYNEEVVDNTSNNEYSKPISNNSDQNNNSNIKEYIDIPNLFGMTEQEAINVVKKLGAQYEIVYKEDIGKEEGIVLDQSRHDYIVRNSKGEIISAISTRRLYPGETLSIIINKYEERTLLLNIHRTCLIEEYLQSTGKDMETTLDFIVKANGNVIFSDKLTKEDLNVELYNCTSSKVSYKGKIPPQIEILVNGKIIQTFTSEEMYDRFYGTPTNPNEGWYIVFKEHGAG